jgi:hypothetical protein
MKSKIQKLHLLLGVWLMILLTASFVFSQVDTTPKKRLRSPAIVKGFIGGESHDSYVIRARRGQTITVRISWRRSSDNRAEFSVSKSANFFNGDSVNFGKESEGGKRWTGKIPETRNYYIYVVAHPTARYTLRVTVE